MQRFMITYPADINVQEAVIVDVHDGYTGGPGTVGRNLSFCRNVFEMKPPFIEVKSVGDLIGSKENIYLTVIVKICRPDATAVLEIHVFKYIEFLGGS